MSTGSTPSGDPAGPVLLGGDRDSPYPGVGRNPGGEGVFRPLDSNHRGVMNAVRVARDFASYHVNEQITELLSPIPGVEQIEEIHAHRFGPYLVANVTIGVDGALSVAEGDRIATQVEHTLIEHIEYMHRVYVHYHPAASPDTAPVT